MGVKFPTQITLSTIPNVKPLPRPTWGLVFVIDKDLEFITETMYESYDSDLVYIQPLYTGDVDDVPDFSDRELWELHGSHRTIRLLNPYYNPNTEAAIKFITEDYYKIDDRFKYSVIE